MSEYLKYFNENKLLSSSAEEEVNPSDEYDLMIRFHLIENLLCQKTFFLCQIDDKISFRFDIQSIGKWMDEEWFILNVPSNVKLIIRIFSLDDLHLIDKYLGQIEVNNIESSRNVYPIIGQPQSRFHLQVEFKKSSFESVKLPRYTFDGPSRYSRYDSLDNNQIYSIWKVELRRISLYFPLNNEQFKCSSSMFSYEQNKIQMVKPSENGRLKTTDDLWKFIFRDRETQQMQPRAFNYIIDDQSWIFSEITHQFFTDFEVKHVKLGEYSQSILYAGEFHLRPKFGWNQTDDQWEIVFSNASGTYSPNSSLLIDLKELFLFNFPSLNLVTYDYKDPLLKDSLEQFQMAANKYKRMKK